MWNLRNLKCEPEVITWFAIVAWLITVAFIATGFIAVRVECPKCKHSYDEGYRAGHSDGLDDLQVFLMEQDLQSSNCGIQPK